MEDLNHLQLDLPYCLWLLWLTEGSLLTAGSVYSMTLEMTKAALALVRSVCLSYSTVERLKAAIAFVRREPLLLDAEGAHEIPQ